MSEPIVKRIVALIQAHAPSAPFEDGGLAVFRDVIIDLARNAADHAFWRTETELGWTSQSVVNLSKGTAEGYAGAIAEITHQMGGTVDMATGLGDVWLSAYNGRLADLHASPCEGGHA